MAEMAEKSDMPQFEYWTNRWNKGDTPWHLDGVYPLLETNQDVILAGKQDAQVYLPMCGKAPDLAWFYGKGHRVVGVEYIEEVARGFFVDNNLPFDEAECPVLKCKIFQTADKRLRIFVCSVFDFNKSCAGPMDIVWDRGAFSSIDVELRGRYVTLMKSLLSPNFSYALWTIVYDDSTFKGFPTSMPEAVIRELFAWVQTQPMLQARACGPEQCLYCTSARAWKGRWKPGARACSIGCVWTQAETKYKQMLKARRRKATNPC